MSTYSILGHHYNLLLHNASSDFEGRSEIPLMLIIADTKAFWHPVLQYSLEPPQYPHFEPQSPNPEFLHVKLSRGQ
jgi:hypothetical protein